MQKYIYALFLTIYSTMVMAYSPTMTINNHYDKPLKFIVGINPEVLADVPAEFSLNPQQKLMTRVMDLNKEAYIRVEADDVNNAFWGVEAKTDAVQIYGYLSHGIAYSWNNKEIIFCTPEEYKKKNSC